MLLCLYPLQSFNDLTDIRGVELQRAIITTPARKSHQHRSIALLTSGFVKKQRPSLTQALNSPQPHHNTETLTCNTSIHSTAVSSPRSADTVFRRAFRDKMSTLTSGVLSYSRRIAGYASIVIGWMRESCRHHWPPRGLTWLLTRFNS